MSSPDPSYRLGVVERRLRELGPVLQSDFGPGQCIGIGAELVQLADVVSRVRDLLAIVVLDELGEHRRALLRVLEARAWLLLVTAWLESPPELPA